MKLVRRGHQCCRCFRRVERRIVMRFICNDTKKDLPIDQLHKLFVDVGWADDGSLSEDMKETDIILTKRSKWQGGKRE